MRRAGRRLGSLLAVAMIAACAAPQPIPPVEPQDMVPRSIAARLPVNADILVDQPALKSSAKEETSTSQQLAGRFPFFQPEALQNYRESVRLALQAAGARTAAAPRPGAYVLKTTVLGGATIPFPQFYTVLFVHYELEAAGGGSVVWQMTVYSQAKIETRERGAEATPGPDPAYGRLAAANIRQMVDSLSKWFAKSNPSAGRVNETGERHG